MAAARPRRRGAAAGSVAALVLIGLTGCGSSSTTLSESARTALHQDVAAIRAAAGTPAAAQAAVATFRGHVNDLVAKDRLDPADALQLIAHASRIETRLDEAAAATPTAAPSATPKAVPAKAEHRAPAVRAVDLAKYWKAWSKGDKGHHKGRGGHDDG